MMVEQRRRELVHFLRSEASQPGANDEISVPEADQFPSGEQETLSIAAEFLDSWTDARIHDFAGYASGHVSKEEWPVLARILANDLENQRPVTDPRLLEFRGQKEALQREIRHLSSAAIGLVLGALAGGVLTRASVSGIWLSALLGAFLGLSSSRWRDRRERQD